jgi:hypothetical protein
MSTTDEIMELAAEWAQETKDFGHLDESRPRDALLKAVEALMSDAAQWKAYKARKDAALSAGFGRSPLRGEVAPDTYAVINEYGQVEYSARWIEACHDHIKDMQEVLPPRATSKWKVRGIKILEKAP